MKKNVMIVILLLFVIVGAVFYFFFPDDYFFIGPEEPVYSVGLVSNPKGIFANVSLTSIDTVPNADTYTLPLNISSVINLQRDIYGKGFSISTDAQQNLEQNGFVALEGNKKERFSYAYSELNMKDIPIFITTDSTLHLYHIYYSQILKNVEINEFIPMLKAMTNSLVEKSVAQYKGAYGNLKEAARKNVAYLSVAGKLLDPDFSVPSFVSDVVNQELELIEKHEGFAESPLFSNPCPCKPCEQYQENVDCIREYPECLCEDYSQYVSRGHYTQTEDLKRYFKAMMWFGRMGMRIKSDNETMQAVLLTDALKSTNTNYKDMSASDIWSRMYKVTGFFVGTSDDLTFYEYDKAVTELFGETFDENILLDENNMSKLKEKLRELRIPEIHSGFVIDTLNLTEETQGLRLMGQRYTPDSYVLWKTVFNNVGPNPQDTNFDYIVDQIPTGCLFDLERYPFCHPEIIKENASNCNLTREQWTCTCGCGIRLYKETGNEDYAKVCRIWPSGLDVMSILGSRKADELQESQSNYCGYSERITELKQEFSQYTTEDWTKNIYWSWLWVLQPLLEDFGSGYPIWMQTDAWQTKELNTALSSWSELRHDTILYVKQSYTTPGMIGATSVEPMEAKYYGYVEPVPEFYAKLKDLTELTKNGLREQEVITLEIEQSLTSVSELLETLKTVAEKELTQQDLTDEEYDAINNIGNTFDSIIEDLAASITVDTGGGWGQQKAGTYLEGEEDAYKTTLIADVHTETNTEKVLEVGTGYVDWIIVVHKSKDGQLGAAVGPIFTYYEFEHPMDDRLTDEQWREMLKTNPPAKLEWLEEIYK